MRFERLTVCRLRSALFLPSYFTGTPLKYCLASTNLAENVHENVQSLTNPANAKSGTLTRDRRTATTGSRCLLQLLHELLTVKLINILIACIAAGPIVGRQRRGYDVVMM